MGASRRARLDRLNLTSNPDAPRHGTPCKGPAMLNGRCRMHGGTSTGPRTKRGIARSRRANWKTGCILQKRNGRPLEIPLAKQEEQFGSKLFGLQR